MKDGTVPNLVFTDEKKFDVQQCLNHQNDRVLSRDGSVEGRRVWSRDGSVGGRRVWSRDGSVEGRRVSRRRNPLSVMVWAAITATGRSQSFLYPQE